MTASVYVFFIYVALTSHFQENMPAIIGFASATHIRSAVSPRFTNTGSFSALTLGASEGKKKGIRLRQEQCQPGTNDLANH